MTDQRYVPRGDVSADDQHGRASSSTLVGGVSGDAPPSAGRELLRVSAETTTAPRTAAIGITSVLVGVFVARPLFASTVSLLAMFGALLVVGGAWPIVRDQRSSARAALATLAAGSAILAFGRTLGGVHPVMPTRPSYLAAAVLAAVAEELFFRRLMYALLAPGGAAVAIAGTTALFAVAHVTVYGWWVLPLDLGAGAVLGWQRWVTGRWTVPAATHVIANLLVLL